MNIGFVGVGQMGIGMVLNLMTAGHAVQFYSRRQSPLTDEASGAGAARVQSLDDLGRWTDVVILCLTDTQATQEVVAALMPKLPARTLIIDTTTNDTDGPRQIADSLRMRGVAYIEAPVTGGVQQSRDGVLGAIVGADSEADFLAAQPILDTFSKKVAHIGPVGTAARAKLVSNFLALGTATLVIEVFKQARALGIDWKSLYELAQLGSGNSASLQRIVGRAVQGDHKGYVFSVANCHKDLEYLCQMGESTGTLSTLAPAFRDVHVQAVGAGLGQRFISELLEDVNQATERGSSDEPALR